ncbi:hypothetical protein [Bacteroides sp. Marseille-P3684]|uniref:hypothetical protein n=1 Tax=Bacteroides sp. Marseille-P3684 TaxID=2086579 RepID=UPI001300B4ED|nr:hypothetical protein [Bacteroides sp. Marseille-P3684]
MFSFKKLSRFVTKKPCDAKKRKKESVWLSDVMCSFCSEKVRLKVRAPSHAPCVYFGAFAESDGDCSPVGTDCQSVKTSNESLEKAFRRIQPGVGGKNCHFRAIREIHNDTFFAAWWTQGIPVLSNDVIVNAKERNSFAKSHI